MQIRWYSVNQNQEIDREYSANNNKNKHKKWISTIGMNPNTGTNHAIVIRALNSRNAAFLRKETNRERKILNSYDILNW